MATMEQVEVACREYSEANDNLNEIKSQLETEVEAIKARYYRKVKSAIDHVVSKHSDLSELVSESRDLFVNPKTVIFHGVKVGYIKGNDVLEVKKPKVTVELIKDLYEEDFQKTLIKVTETPIKDAIKQLEPDEIKDLKCKLIPGKDEIHISTVDTEVDKLIDSLTKQALEIE
ncbi:MAG TPA: host-nuclease inhibitor Gam family protein [Ignavibacteria bacterium]|nr:hypothetical protein [Bacteroidota bacterium]HRE10784.1 host-nuclease inhibitor Gam family protein [Ignavibacteria bacterium]HRF65973.1 host-nuclease inhibitor Gam family protein [Ignavibacteria bacterium]HRJ02814.1 host-nuclease inhibitor Gam family protein [Ignavibacteria bacterium]HRJ84372.1 host-nuclease inhibitor Gam family protein [Ignavibacteria bacterium]